MYTLPAERTEAKFRIIAWSGSGRARSDERIYSSRGERVLSKKLDLTGQRFGGIDRYSPGGEGREAHSMALPLRPLRAGRRGDHSPAAERTGYLLRL